MTVTENGLININRKLVDERKYSAQLISTIGNVNVIKGTASNFSKTSYLFSEGITPKETIKDLTVVFNGLVVPAEKTQIAWELKSETGSLALLVVNNVVTVTINSEAVLSLPNSPISHNTPVQIRTSFKKNKIELFLLLDDEPDKEVLDLESKMLDLTGSKMLSIGGSSEYPENFWLGSVDLPKFLILDDTELLYSPSTGAKLSISKVVLSDGTFPMTETPMSIANHMYALDVAEISGSGNTVMITSEIGAEEKLVIREVGLYAVGNNGSFLFGKIDNLNINKGANVSYELMLTLNVATSFVNMTGFPKIVLRMPDLTTLDYFSRIQKTVPTVMTDLERLILRNAYEIGFNRDQIFYRLQQNIASLEDCYSAIQTYDKLMKRFQKTQKEELNFSNIKIVGDIKVSSDLQASNFNANSYLSSYVDFDPENDWKITAGFRTTTNITEEQVVLTSGIPTSKQPFSLYVKDGKCNLTMKTNTLLSTKLPGDLSKDYFRDPSVDYTVAFKEGDVTKKKAYYGYSVPGVSSSEGSSSITDLYNFHTKTLDSTKAKDTGVRNSQNYSPSSNEKLFWSPTTGINMSSWSMFITTKISINNSNTQYIIGNVSSQNVSPFKIYIDSTRRLNFEIPELNFAQFSEEPVISGKCNISVECVDGVYTLNYECVDGATTISGTIVSPEELGIVTLNANNKLAFGFNESDEGTLFQGEFYMAECSLSTDNVQESATLSDLSWVGASSLDSIFTADLVATPGSSLFDSSEYPVNSITIAPKQQDILSRALFDVSYEVEYIVKIEYLNGKYSFEYSTNGAPFVAIQDIPDTISGVLSPLYNIYLGAYPAFSNTSVEPLEPSEMTHPLLLGSEIPLASYKINSVAEDWNPIVTTTLGDYQLVQDFYIQRFNKSHYQLTDIHDSSCVLDVSENQIQGNKDNINFNTNPGFTLCAKVFLEDSSPKLILAKSDLKDTLDFALYFANNRLVLVLNTLSSSIWDDEDIKVIKELEPKEIYSFVSSPILITTKVANKNGNYSITLFKNNEELINVQGYAARLGAHNSKTFLTNYLPDNLLTRVLSGESNINYSAEDMKNKIQENTSLRISNIIGITGVLNTKGLYYITNLTDTNF